jgi:hypothetical protein
MIGRYNEHRSLHICGVARGVHSAIHQHDNSKVVLPSKPNVGNIGGPVDVGVRQGGRETGC